MFIQTDRPLQLKTPLGADALIVSAIRGREAISELFHFEIDVMWQDKNKPLAFEDLLGQKVTLEMTVKTEKRYIGGIVVRVAQGGTDKYFIRYRLDIAPQLWLLTRRVQSRMFQQMNVPDILKKVLEGLDVAYEIQGTFEPREYCVQYHESDFNFFSRLAEEEGIYYYFKHTAKGHQLLVANKPQSHADIPYDPEVDFELAAAAHLSDKRILEWRKEQEIRSGKYTLWDEIFQMPGKHLDATKTIQETVQAGKTTHKLKVGGNDKLEIYEFPGDYARRFDGVNKGGGDQAGNLQKIFADNKRTVDIRMQQEALGSLSIRGWARHAGFTAGHAFELKGHFSDDGKYVLTSVEHHASQPIHVEDQTPFTYENHFTCIPAALPYSPPRRAQAPSVRGVQLGTVVGPSNEEIFTDQYGRIKVQFRWDRDGKYDANSSCWMRVATPWAGKQWGAIHIPRIGQEVIIDFEEGDVDHPIVVGSVYNADMMPPYSLPDNKTQSGIKSRSTKFGDAENFNEIRFEDKKGSEEIFIHAEWNMKTEVENDMSTTVEHDETRTVHHDRTTNIENDETKTVEQGNELTTIQTGDRTIKVQHGNQTTTLDVGNMETRIKSGNMTTKIDLGKSEEEAMQSIELKVGQSSIKLDQQGVTIKGMMIKIEGQTMVDVKGLMTTVSGDAMLTAKGGVVMIN